MKVNKNTKGEKHLPMILVILDGWGIGEANKGNAITQSKTPVINSLLERYPNTLVCAHGECVGLSKMEDGNSEAGHLNIGAGRIVEQDAVVITKSIEDGTFFKNPAFKEAVMNVKRNNSRLHLIGMLSNGMSAHSDPRHLMALLKFTRSQGISEVFLHLFTDGRDSPKYAAMKLADELENKLQKGEKVATVMGRYYGMDRKKEWVRTEMAYNALVFGEARVAEGIKDAITEAYNRGENDEYIEPYVIAESGTITPRINDRDSIIFFNLRSDRARQLAKVFVQKKFCEMNAGCFERRKILKDIVFIGMTDFGPDLDDILTAFPSMDIPDTLPMQLKDLKQLYIAETEKYAHVTYFFNGGYIGKVAGESQIMIDSPTVKFYEETPGMSTVALADRVIAELGAGNYDFTVLNFAAPDMIGHTGNLKAAIECCEIVDKELGRVVEAYLSIGGTVLVTADHGNIEEMVNLETGEIDTEHSKNPVPFIVVHNNAKEKYDLDKDGKLCDIAPTILDLLGKAKPSMMTGRSLLLKL